MKVMKPFVITTALMSSLFIGAEVVQPTSSSNASGEGDTNVDENSNIVLTESAAQVDNMPLMQSNFEVKNEPAFIDSLTLVNESLQQVLSLLEKWTDRILVIGSNLPKATFNLNIPMPLSREEAISVLKSVLSANGIGVTPLNDKALRIIPLNRAKNSSPEIIKREDLKAHAGSQEICCCLFRVNNLTAREAARIITPWLTPLSSSIVTLDKANSLFVTDYVSNLQQLDKIFSRIDKVGDVQESILFFNPKNTSAESLKKNFEGLQQGALKCYLLGNTSFAADKDTNLFIVITPKGNEPLIHQFVEKYDVNVDPLIQHHVFRIQHGSCKEMTELVKKLMQQQMQTGTENSATSNNANTFSKQLSIECDERLNAIVVYGTPSDIRQVEQLVKQLDVILPQVRIEVIIAEVKLTKGQASGLESFGYSVSRGYNGDARLPDGPYKTSHTFGNITTSALSSGTSGLKISKLKLPLINMDSVLNTAKMDNNISILSSPTLLTTHAREATLKITETRPYFSSIQTKAGATTSDPDVSNSTIEKVDAGIELVVKPLIGLNGVIQLEIDQKVDNFTTETTALAGSRAALPHINRREAKSFISVKSGEMLVLGGLKQKEVIDQQKKMFLLGDIPLVGNALFSGTTKEEVVKELIIFIRPFLLANEETAQSDTETFNSHLEPVLKEEVDAYKNDGRFSKKSIFTPKKGRSAQLNKKATLHGKRARLRQQKSIDQSNK